MLLEQKVSLMKHNTINECSLREPMTAINQLKSDQPSPVHPEFRIKKKHAEVGYFDLYSQVARLRRSSMKLALQSMKTLMSFVCVKIKELFITVNNSSLISGLDIFVF